MEASLSSPPPSADINVLLDEDEMHHHLESRTHRSAIVEDNPQLLCKQPSAKILCIGDDAILLHSRLHLLRKAGYDVHCCPSDRAVQVCRLSTFDIALICRSVSDERSVLLTQALREVRPDLRIVRLKPTSPPELKLYDLAVDTARGPVTFLRDLGEFVTHQLYMQ